MARAKETLETIRARVAEGLFDDSDIRRMRRDSRKSVKDLARRAQAMQTAQQAEANRLLSMLTYEHELWGQGILHIAGVDEVGAGPLAGPVVAAAVVLPQGTSIEGIDDSKRLTAEQRESLYTTITECALAFAFGSCSPLEIDTINILQASRLAMHRAVVALPIVAHHLLVDARLVPHVETPQTAIVRGDSLSQSIAAASILAKVHRDALMRELSQVYPGYGFETHCGYATQYHMRALRRLGPSPLHRRSFAPVTALVSGQQMLEFTQVSRFDDPIDSPASSPEAHQDTKPHQVRLSPEAAI